MINHRIVIAACLMLGASLSAAAQWNNFYSSNGSITATYSNVPVGFGGIHATSAVDVSGAGSGGTIRVRPLYTNNESSIGLYTTTDASGTPWMLTQGGWGNTGKLIFGYGNPFMTLTQNGNVGIGTTSPAYTLDVTGTINATSFMLGGSPLYNFWANQGEGSISYSGVSATKVGIGTTNPGYTLDVNGTINATGLRVAGQTLTNSQWATSGSTISYVAGNVGIGKTNPSAALDVNGAINATGININGSPVTPSQWTTTNGNIIYNGYVGVGKTPTVSLDVVGAINADSYINTPLISTAQIDLNGTNLVPTQWANTGAGANISFTNGNVGIGTSTNLGMLDVAGKMYVYAGNGTPSVRSAVMSKYGMFVEQGVLSEDFAIAPAASWADFVFEKNYRLRSIEELKQYISQNSHLPDIPSANEVKANGYSVHDMNKHMVEKIEELTKYIIDQHDKYEQLEKEMEALRKIVEAKK